jgi:hypothetical protein
MGSKEILYMGSPESVSQDFTLLRSCTMQETQET